MNKCTAITLRGALFALVGVGLVGCAGQTATSSSGQADVSGRSKLSADVRQCSQRYGYDPDKVTGVAENALAPQELEWRQCAYDAVNMYARANPAMADRYERLIAEDISMTTAIQQGTMTRSQRRARIEQLIAQIRAAEDAQIKAATAEQESQMRQVRDVVDGMRGFSY